MIKLNSKKPVFFKEVTLDMPIFFVDLYILNPKNFKKWIPKIGHSKKKFDEIKVKDLLNTRVSAKVEDSAFLLDVSFGKETHEIMVKKPSLNDGLDLIITKGGDFKFEANIKLTSLPDEQTKITVTVTLLEAKHSFHPITSFELKYFFNKLLSNFVNECEKSYRTMKTEEKTLEAYLMSFYESNVNQFNSLVNVLRDDLGEDEIKHIEEKFKTLAFNSYDKLSKVFTTISSASLPHVNINLILIRLGFFVEEHIFALKNIIGSNRADTLANINKLAAVQLKNLDSKVEALLEGIDSEKIYEIESSLNSFVLSLLNDINDIVKEIKAKIPPQHFKDFEIGMLDIVKTDLESTKSLLSKFDITNKALTANENNILNNLIATVDKYETIISEKESTIFTRVLDMSKKSLEELISTLNKISDDVSVEKIEIAKLLAIRATKKTYDAMSSTLAKLEPEKLAENEAAFDEKIADLLDSYARVLEIVAPNSTKDKIENMKSKIEKTLKDEYHSFCATSK